jgi:SET domain-containing protein
MDGAAQYIFELSSVATPDGRKVLIDAGPCGNETRFINWHRGLAPAPNCKFEEARVLRGGGCCSELVVRVVAVRRILRDEELLIDYGGLYDKREGLLDDDDDE